MAGDKPERLFISLRQRVACVLVHCAFRTMLQIQSPVVAHSDVSVAGFGDWGPLGPRKGMSGRGLPGGFSIGGMVGVPGVAGGISGGSIGIYMATLRLSPISGRILCVVIGHINFVRSDNGSGVPMFLIGAGGTHSGPWHTASMLWPSGSSTNAP